MRHYYDDEFFHVVDYHQEEIMQTLREQYTDDLFEQIESYLRGCVNDQKLIAQIRDYIIAAAELVYENHEE